MTSVSKYTVTLTLAALLLLPVMAAAQAQPLTITHGPDVEYVGATSTQVAWTTSTGGSSIIRYGTNPNNLNQTAEEPYQTSSGNQHVTHRVLIKNLQPNTTYYFVVDSGQGQGTGSETKSQVESFTTRAQGTGHTGEGNLSGTVKDPAGTQNIAGATVKVAGPASNTLTTDSQGVWRMDPTPTGTYTITVTAPGYKPQTQTITVDSNSPAHINMRLSR